MSDEPNARPDDEPLKVSPGLEPTKNESPDSASPKSPTSAAGGDQNSMSNIFSDFTSEKTSFEGVHREVNYYFNQNQGMPNIVIRHFSFNEIRPIAAERQAEIAELFVGDPDEIGRLSSLIVNKRILVLTGEPELGKTTTAIYLGSTLSARTASKNGDDHSLSTYLISPLDRYARIDLNEIWDSEETASRVVIFKHVFSRGNHDLRSFFAQLNEYSVDEFISKLRASNSYLIFTTTTTDASQFLSGYAASDLQHELKHLNDDLLCQGLEKRVAYLEQTTKPSTELLEQLKNPEQKQIVIAGLRTMPRIVRFVEAYLSSDPTTAMETDLSEAIRQFGDIRYWFHNELAADFDMWCFTLALGLSHWAADFQGVPWIDFDYVHRGIAQHLRRDPQLFPSNKNTKEQEPLEITPNLTDDIYLAQSRAEVIKDPNSLADVVRFCQESYSHKLWEILLKHHRRVLMTLLPRLRDLAENHNAEADSRQRELCARIIGRVGEIDPERVTLSVMNRWIESDDVRQRANIGALYQGILASNNERYKNYFLDVLKSLTASIQTSEDGRDDVSQEEREELKGRLLTAIAVYSRIGDPNLSLAMTGLNSIARDRLVPIMADVQRIGRLMESTKSKFAQQTSAREAVGLLVFHEMLSDLAERLYNQQASTFVGVQYALTSLCLSVDPISVFKELRIWIESSNQATGALVALMFLIKDGISSTLESMQVEVSGGDSLFEERKSCNPIVASLTSGQESVVEMARFLVTIFEAFSVTFFLPKQFQDYLRKSFMLHLTTWIEEALHIESSRKAMEDLLVELMRIHKRVLYKPLDDLLNGPNFLKAEPELKRSFVNAVLWPVL
ncbi:MAG TPA: hypothetical protein VJU84_14360 [Pyrinomonadaceae bacterium]|nr:hypothetical protein [Pyrinomonadaceae bacterium]